MLTSRLLIHTIYYSALDGVKILPTSSTYSKCASCLAIPPTFSTYEFRTHPDDKTENKHAQYNDNAYRNRSKQKTVSNKISLIDHI